VFKTKRNTVNVVAEKMPGLINPRDPLHMNNVSRQVFKKHGCSKEQQKQYMKFINDKSKNDPTLRK
jgi:hypothetical protein